MNNQPPPSTPTGVQTVATGNGWYIIHGDQLANMPALTWLVKGEIPTNGIVTIFGAPGSGKSLLALDYALHLSQQVPVLYMTDEGQMGFKQRVAAWQAHHHTGVGRFHMLLGAFPLLEQSRVLELIRSVKQMGLFLVIIDTLACYMAGGDENSTRDMQAFIASCKLLRDLLCCTVVIVHHTNKGGRAERGNTSLRGSCDIMIRVTKDDDLIRADCSKTKDADPFADKLLTIRPMQITLDGEKLESGVLIPSHQKIQNEQDKLTRNQRRIVEALAAEVFSEGADTPDIMEMTENPSRGNVLKNLSQLIRFGYVEQHGKRAPYKLTEKGRNYLTPLTPKTPMTPSNISILKSKESTESMESMESVEQQSFLTEDMSGVSYYAEGL
jgi:hypothetical protein